MPRELTVTAERRDKNKSHCPRMDLTETGVSFMMITNKRPRYDVVFVVELYKQVIRRQRNHWLMR